jgi:hypothetical protein
LADYAIYTHLSAKSGLSGRLVVQGNLNQGAPWENGVYNRRGCFYEESRPQTSLSPFILRQSFEMQFIFSRLSVSSAPVFPSLQGQGYI